MQAAARKVCLAAGRADTAAAENGSKSRRKNMSEEKVTLSDGKEAARQQILDLVAEYCDKYHNQKKNLPRDSGFRMRPVFTITMRWSIW